MATTEQWIEWSRGYAEREWGVNHQLFLEVAMLATRYTRDTVPGASVIPELANADHYWLARYLCYLAAGSVGRITGTPGDLISPMFGQLLGIAGSYVGGGGATILVSAMALSWDLLKRGCRLVGVQPPGGGARASAPNSEQLYWALRGNAAATTLDMPYADQAILTSTAVNDFNWAFRPLPEMP